MTMFGKSTCSSRPRWLWILLLLLPGVTAAEQSPGWWDDLQLHGFLSQGYVKSSDNSFYGDSEQGSFDFREIGLNASFRFSPRWLVSAQLLSRKAGEMSDGGVNLDYGLVDFTVLSDEYRRVGLVVGRFKNPIGLYNDTRDVPFTRPSVFLPQSVYWDKLRDIMLSNDGVQLYGELYRGRHGLSLQLGVGNPPIDDNLEWAYLGYDWPGSVESDSPGIVGRALYELDDGRLRLALSGITTTMAYRPAAIDLLAAGSIDIDYFVGSFQYNGENWSLTAEYMQEPVRWSGFGDVVRDKRNTADGVYLQGTYRPLPDWELLLRYDAAFLDNSDRDGERQGAEKGLPAHLFYSHTWTFGLTWSPNEHIMLRGQYDRVDGTAFLSNEENPNPFATVRNWDMFSLLLSVGF